MATFYITFGSRYHSEVHPKLGARPELPDGWLTVEAETENEARTIVFDSIGPAWAFLYDKAPSRRLFRAGHLGSLQQALAHHRG